MIIPSTSRLLVSCRPYHSSPSSYYYQVDMTSSEEDIQLDLEADIHWDHAGRRHQDEADNQVAYRLHLVEDNSWDLEEEIEGS